MGKYCILMNIDGYRQDDNYANVITYYYVLTSVKSFFFNWFLMVEVIN